MKKCSAFILLACVFSSADDGARRGRAGHLGFLRHMCATDSGIGCDPKQQYPALLATLTLLGPDSSGSAKWDGLPQAPPVYTGDSFSLDFSSTYQPLSPNFAGNLQCSGPKMICDFDVSWSEAAGQLDAVSIIVNGFHDAIGEDTPPVPFGLSGGLIATDDTFFGAGEFSGCVEGVCRVSGSWTNASLVTEPEPGSLALLASALGVWALPGGGVRGIAWRAELPSSRLDEPHAHEMRADSDQTS